MAITIEGIKIKSMSLDRDEHGKFKITGSYELVSSTGVTIAKQGFNGYNEIKLENSSDTLSALDTLVKGMQTDLNKTLGLN